MVVGDRIDSEIKIGNELKITTIRILKGIYNKTKSQQISEQPNFEIKNIKEIFDVIASLNNKENNVDNSNFNIAKKEDKKLKIVAIGGGTGLPTIVEGLRKYTDDLTMIVTVTDSGRSSGILRKELNILPPGDIRNCLISLSNSEKLMCDLFNYRFEDGRLEGHSFGNLFIAALTKLTGSFEKAIEEAGKILKLRGKVLPSTLDNVHICAELENGTLIEEENEIIDRKNNDVHLRSSIKRVFLKPSANANKRALEAIREADLIVLGPGSLFTSIITNLLVKGISEEINVSRAKKIYICNIMTQVSQTYKYKASRHVESILNYLDKLDYVILNNEKPGHELIESYARENAHLVENDIKEIEKLGVKVILDNFLDKAKEKKLLWEKRDLLRHDSDKVAEVLVGIINRDNGIF